jgi:hypothetical protein
MKKIGLHYYAFLLTIVGTIFLSIIPTNAQNQNSSESEAGPYVIGEPGIGSVEELNKVLGNNTEMLTNGTNISNDNASMFEQLNKESQINQSSSGTNQASTSGTNQSSTSGTNQSEPITEQEEGNQTQNITQNPLSDIEKAIENIFN